MPEPSAGRLPLALDVTPTPGGLLLHNGADHLDLTYAELDALVHLLAQLQQGQALTLDTSRSGTIDLRAQQGHVQIQAQGFLLDSPPELHWLPYTFCFLAAYAGETPRECILRRTMIVYCATCFQEAQRHQMAPQNPRPEERRATPEA